MAKKLLQIPANREYVKVNISDDDVRTDKIEFYFDFEGYDLVRKYEIPKGDYMTFWDCLNGYSDNELSLNEWVILKNEANSELKKHLKKEHDIDLDKYDRFMPWATVDEWNKASNEVHYYIETLDGISLRDLYDTNFGKVEDVKRLGLNKFRIELER